LRARERLADSLFDSILLRLRSSPALALPLPPSMLLSGLELRRDGDDMVGFLGQEPEKNPLFFGGGRKQMIQRRQETKRREIEI